MASKNVFFPRGLQTQSDKGASALQWDGKKLAVVIHSILMAN